MVKKAKTAKKVEKEKKVVERKNKIVRKKAEADKTVEIDNKSWNNNVTGNYIKNENNTAIAILDTISALLFLMAGVACFFGEGFNWLGITDLALAVSFGSMAYVYYKRAKEEKK